MHDIRILLDTYALTNSRISTTIDDFTSLNTCNGTHRATRSRAGSRAKSSGGGSRQHDDDQ